jgi:hypothetical protein
MVYWIEKTSGKIRRCRYDECTSENVQLVKHGLSNPEGIAYDVQAEMLYWTNTDANRIERCDPSTDCHKTTETVVEGDDAGEPLRLALDSKRKFLYWSDRNEWKVKRCDLKTKNAICGDILTVVDNGETAMGAGGFAGVPYGLGIDSENQYLYWSGSSAVSRCYIPEYGGMPCSPKPVVGPLPQLAGIVGLGLNKKHKKVYFSLHGLKVQEVAMAENNHEIDIHDVTDSTAGGVRGLTVDSTSDTLYMADGVAVGDASFIRRCDAFGDVHTCANTRVLIKGCPVASDCLAMPYDIALDWDEDSIKPRSHELPLEATLSGPGNAPPEE